MSDKKINSKMLKHFGYRHLSFIFRTLVIINENGFYFKRKYYTWKDVLQIKAFEKAIPDEGGTYGMGRGEIHLNIGKILLVKEENLERKDGGLGDGFSSSFDELIFELKKYHKKHLNL